MKKITFIFLIIISGLNLSAQTYTQTIRGKVIDADSKSTIPGATIILVNSDTLIGSSSDGEGKFRLDKIPVGRRALKISSIGYEEILLSLPEKKLFSTLN